MKYLIANWKMNLGIRESIALSRAAMLSIQGSEVAPQIILCPAMTALHEVHKTIARSRVALGAQNAGPGRFGAYTGEVGLSQLEDVGCAYALLGHSERRAMGETDESIALRLKALYEQSNLTPIVCVGEKEKGSGGADAVASLMRILRDIDVPRNRRLIVAYEPVWAIGSGTPAVPAEVVAIVERLRDAALDRGAREEALHVLYGGSVNAGNAYMYLREPSIDGLLIGGASLKAAEFREIVDSARDVMLSQTEV